MSQRHCSRSLQHRMTRRQALRLAGSTAVGAFLAAPTRGDSLIRPRSPALAAAQFGFEVPDPTIPLRVQLVAPQDTDPAIDEALGPHGVAISYAPSRDRLFLFLPGTAASALGARSLSEQAARNGFHAINLSYPNANAVQDLCGLDPDMGCFENVRLAIIDGTDRTATVTISRANSIENRLLKLLASLDGQHPEEGWGNFVEGDALKWSSIIVAGHSQGGGHAALLGRDHIVARVVMLSAPVDHIGPRERQVDSSTPAPWLLGGHATPSDRYYAFGHVRDERNDWQLQWPALGLGLTDFGPIVNVDEDEPPYHGSHLLLTDAKPRDNPNAEIPNHASIAENSVTPLTDAGQPLFAPVWQYVCFS